MKTLFILDTLLQPQIHFAATLENTSMRYHSITWINRPADFYALRHTAKHLGQPRGMSKQRCRQVKANVRNDLHFLMDEIRAAATPADIQLDSTASCWLRELADLRARVTQADTYKARGVEFRPLFLLSLAEMEITAQIAEDSPEYFREQYLLLPSSTSGVSANDR